MSRAVVTVLCDACWKENDAAAVCHSCGRPLVPAVLDQPRFRITRANRQTLVRRLTCFVLIQLLVIALYGLTISLTWAHDQPSESLGSTAALLLNIALISAVLDVPAISAAFDDNSLITGLLILPLVHLLLSWAAIVFVDRAGHATLALVRRRSASRASETIEPGQWVAGVLATTMASFIFLLLAEAVAAVSLLYASIGIFVLGHRGGL